VLVVAALRAPANVSAAALLTSDVGRVLVTWTTPACTHSSGLVDSFIVEYCVATARNNCSAGPHFAMFIGRLSNQIKMLIYTAPHKQRS